MMKIIRYALLGVCSVFLLSGCSSGKEADTPASSTEIKVSVTAKSDPATSETVSTRSSDTQTTQSSSETESVASQGVRLSDA